jgi:hypothetical protein
LPLNQVSLARTHRCMVDTFKTPIVDAAAVKAALSPVGLRVSLLARCVRPAGPFKPTAEEPSKRRRTAACYFCRRRRRRMVVSKRKRKVKSLLARFSQNAAADFGPSKVETKLCLLHEPCC